MCANESKARRSPYAGLSGLSLGFGFGVGVARGDRFGHWEHEARVGLVMPGFGVKNTVGWDDLHDQSAQILPRRGKG